MPLSSQILVAPSPPSTNRTSPSEHHTQIRVDHESEASPSTPAVIGPTPTDSIHKNSEASTLNRIGSVKRKRDIDISKPFQEQALITTTTQFKPDHAQPDPSTHPSPPIESSATLNLRETTAIATCSHSPHFSSTILRPFVDEVADIDGDELDDQSESLMRDDSNHDLENDELESNHGDHHLTQLLEPKLQQQQQQQQQQQEEEEEEGEEEVTESKYSFHIEVKLQPNSTILYDTVRETIGCYITDNFTTLETHTFLPGWADIKFLVNEVHSVYCAECGYATSLIPIRAVNLHIHVYELPNVGEDKITMLCVNPLSSSSSELLDNDDDDDDMSTSGDPAASRIQLPANRYEGLWESLIYDEGLKTRLLNYIYSSIIFAEQNVNPNLISWHRLVLLHGPPGTGKTSLCKSLAQKVSIRLSGIYQKTELVEINSHSLFSKWFSESGKLVNNLFSKIDQIAENPDIFVLVLIDEVESLAGCRSSGASASEPSDALRAVNSLLTALDKLREKKNVLVLTTSNLTGSIDEAFLDRADVKQYIGLPSPEAIYWILKTCLRELIQAQILTRRTFLDYKEVVMIQEEIGEEEEEDCYDNHKMKNNELASSNSLNTKFCTTSLIDVNGKISPTLAQRIRRSSLKLLKISQCAIGMSGRSLRRLPLLAHSRTALGRSSMIGNQKLSMDSYLMGMLEVAQDPTNSNLKCL